MEEQDNIMDEIIEEKSLNLKKLFQARNHLLLQ